MKHSAVEKIVVVLISCFITVVHAQTSTVVLQVNESSPYWSKSLPSGGMGTEIINAISKEMGISTRIEFVPLKRLIADTSNNDIGNPFFYLNNQKFSAVIPIAVMYSSFFTYRKNAKQTAIDMAHTKNKIGVLRGTIDLSSNNKHLQRFEESNSKESLFKKLRAGRIAGIIELNLVGGETIAKLYPHEVRKFDAFVLPESAAPIAIMIDSKYPNGMEIGKQYQEGLHRIIKKGIYQKIVQQYYPKFEVPSTFYRDLSKFEVFYTSYVTEIDL